MNDTTVATATAVLADRLGLRADPTLRRRLEHAIDSAAAERHQDSGPYAASLHADTAALQSLVDRITVQETSFFRDPVQLGAFARLIPELDGPLTVWSAGCSNGQEPYSLAMLLAESGRRDWTVLATDVSSRARARTERAVYEPRELRGLDRRRRQRFFEPTTGGLRITGELRRRVEVRAHNLVSDAPPFTAGSNTVVFCRNVLIYFSTEALADFVGRLARGMPPGGWLFLGYSETLAGVTDQFSLVRLGDAFAYQRALPAPEERPSRPARPKSPRLPAAVPRKPRSAPVAGSVSSTGERLAAGQEASAAGDHTAAVVAFRQAAYLAPDDPLAHLHLGFALEAAGDTVAARRAFTAAAGALRRRGAGGIEPALEGFGIDELHRLLDAKQRGAP